MTRSTVPRLLATGALAAALLSCSPQAPAECFSPRPMGIDTCDVIEGTVLALDTRDEHLDIDAYCSSQCLDVNGVVIVRGYKSLKDAPLLAKIRNVVVLKLYVDTLTDLQGLEALKVERLSLVGEARQLDREPEANFTSLRGLEQDSLDSLSITNTNDVLSGSMLRHVGELSLGDVPVSSVDASALTTSSLIVADCPKVTSIRLGAEPMTVVEISRNPSLTSIKWDPALKVTESVGITHNDSLSNCQALAFATETRSGRRTFERVSNNGPCP